MTKTWCIGGRHYSNTFNTFEYGKLNPKTKKLVKLLEVNVVFMVVINVKFLLSKRLKEKILLKRENAKINTVHLCLIQHGVT